MSGTPLNRQFIYPGNHCFGCGPDNPEGLRIEIHRDGDRTDRLVGLYRPRPTAAGFPGIVREADGKVPFLIKTGITAPDGEVLSEADYEYVRVPQDKFKRVAGLEQLPDHYIRHSGSAA